MEVDRNLLTENKGRAKVRGGIASTSRGTSANFTEGTGSKANVKGAIRKIVTKSLNSHNSRNCNNSPLD